MSIQESKTELPENYEALRAAANRTSSWRDRLAAVEELGKFNTPSTIDVLTHRMNNDTVYRVQEAAYRKLRSFGEDVKQPARRKGELIRGANKTFVRIKKSLPREHSYEAFKEKLRNMRLDLYDAYEGDKGDEFDAWLKSTWEGLLRR
ncbi:HEAT repeat domain-containing protein [Paenibacillus aurantius]|uniref:HEAT repeat domain-containing protein n=1 Tax=Paenibacillus aurantius TaxID=2918900 RepID=A0AA96LFX9_9BACL|nr:HEAT repeat domain-containing protein [Paenibacillus aurantius]WJH36943.1 HEAT repeat domain-containing protein [Paenibacillus sp. CC-CFT747]WNQ12303.1 HEAT repeat domain-containing protein [Paenibacillus aurantius]